MDQLEYGYVGDILKYDEQPDGSLMVYGLASDSGVDLDGQTCDPEWLKAEMPEWFKFANVREQHSSVAAGVGKELTEADGAWMLKSHVVDSNTVAKVKAGVLKGYSIGVRKGQVLKGKAVGAPGGKIVGGKIVEVSLVDRPCNPRATISIAKALGDGPELSAVEPLLVETDPSLWGDDDEPADGVASGHDDDVDGLADDEQDSQAVDGAVDGDDDPGDGLTLFDGLDESEWSEDAPHVDKALSLLDDVADDDDDEEVVISKGLLESLIHGPKDPKRDHGKFAADGGRKKDTAAAAAAARKRREAEAERERKHHGAMDAEALQDANHAQRQGRREEADAHRGRLGSYRKALELREYRAGLRLVADVLDGVIVKSLDDSWRADDGEVIAELAHFAAAEADQLASGGYENAEDVSTLLDVCAAIAKMAGLEPTILQREAIVVDESKASATVDVAEIVKAQVAEQLSEVTKAHEVELAKFRAQVTKMAATPLPGGPVINKSVMPSAPAASSNTRAAHFAELAANPRLAPNIAAAYAAAAVEAAKG